MEDINKILTEKIYRLEKDLEEEKKITSILKIDNEVLRRRISEMVDRFLQYSSICIVYIA